MSIYVAWSIHEEEVPGWSDYPSELPGYAICPDCCMVMGYDEDKDEFVCDACRKRIKVGDLDSSCIYTPMRKPMCCVECGGMFPDCSDFCKTIANYVGD